MSMGVTNIRDRVHSVPKYIRETNDGYIPALRFRQAIVLMCILAWACFAAFLYSAW